MRLKRLTLIYPATILTFGGLGFALLPEFTLDLLQSNQDYGDVMPRLVGMFMVALGSLIGLFVARKDYTYYGYSIVARTGFFVFFFVLYSIDQDPLFLVFPAIVSVGLIASYFVYISEWRAGGSDLT